MSNKFATTQYPTERILQGWYHVTSGPIKVGDLRFNYDEDEWEEVDENDLNEAILPHHLQMNPNYTEHNYFIIRTEGISLFDVDLFNVFVFLEHLPDERYVMVNKILEDDSSAVAYVELTRGEMHHSLETYKVKVIGKLTFTHSK